MAADTTINDINWLDNNTSTTYSIDWGNSISTTAVTGAIGGVLGSSIVGSNGTTGGYGYYTQPNTVWTTGTSTFTFDNRPATTQITSKELRMDDPEADIKIRGTSLMDRIEQIEQRLALINRNPRLEEYWPELKEAAERYQQLAQEFEDKQAVWDRLNQPVAKNTP